MSSSLLLGGSSRGRKRKSDSSNLDKLKEKVSYPNVTGVLSGWIDHCIVHERKHGSFHSTGMLIVHRKTTVL